MKLNKQYESGLYEEEIYALWEKKQAFRADPSSKKPHFSISMPPPNETGTLSLGHALFLTLQDIIARHARQTGHDTLWLPGTDHAALPVNAIIEKKLAEEGTNKHEIGREEFLRITREFVGNSRETMLSQMRAMGASADWSRLRYTLDDSLTRMVNETFVKMYNDGLIYRGSRIVNWDPNLQTTIADDEVEYKEEKSKFYTFKYGPFLIGTARPETKFGDKYVVVHPDDERYKQYKHGDTFEAEWINGKITATILKDASVDPSFGTGAMTITPWHSAVDFDLAEKYNLDKEQIIDFHGNLLAVAGEFAGMPIDKARPLVVEKLDKKGLVVDIDEKYVHNIAVNERGKGVIEPQIKLQWFVNVNKEIVPWKGENRSLKQILQSVVREGDIELIPSRFDKTYFSWIDNLRDWCISRQIWWGHRIPVWYREDTDGKNETYVGVQPPNDDSEGFHAWEQDPDTLDTWFSSALWTFSTLIDQGLAKDYSLDLNQLFEQSPDFQAYHPTSVLETGKDILFFWVARMILATTYTTGQIPFEKVYLHGLIMAEDGKKMSKSRPESIIDPLSVIPKYGTDALRLALITSVSPGNDQTWGWDKIEASKHFCNKLWNIARYIEGIVDKKTTIDDVVLESIADHWIVSRLAKTQQEVSESLDKYSFTEAFSGAYHFVWDDLADWYIEYSKASPNQALLAYLLENVLVLLHPFAPFITETIWQTLAFEDDSLLASKELEDIVGFNVKKAEEFNQLKTITSEVRRLTQAMNLKKPILYYQVSKLVEDNREELINLAGLGGLVVGQAETGVNLVNTDQKLQLEAAKNLIEEYKQALVKDREEQSSVLSKLTARLDNKAYVQNAPENLVQETKEQIEKLRNTLDKISKEIEYIDI